MGGYFNKQLSAAFQGVVLDSVDSDCGTNLTVDVVINDSDKSDYLYRYIVNNGKLLLLDDSNIDKFVNKTVKLRSPMYCQGDKLCSKCAGTLYYKLGITNIGLTATRLAGTLLNLNLKKFHNSTANIKKIDINSIEV